MKKHLLLLLLVLITISTFARKAAPISTAETRWADAFSIAFHLNPEGRIVTTNELCRVFDIQICIRRSYSYAIAESNLSTLTTRSVSLFSTVIDCDDMYSGNLFPDSETTGFKSSEQVSVFPNPSTGKFIITCPSGILKVTVFNMLGNKVFSLTNTKSEKSNEIDLTKFQKGIYFVEIYDGNTIYSEKIVLQ